MLSAVRSFRVRYQSVSFVAKTTLKMQLGPTQSFKTPSEGSYVISAGPSGGSKVRLSLQGRSRPGLGGSLQSSLHLACRPRFMLFGRFFDLVSIRKLSGMAGRHRSRPLGVDSGPGEGGSEGVWWAPEQIYPMLCTSASGPELGHPGRVSAGFLSEKHQICPPAGRRPARVPILMPFR